MAAPHVLSTFGIIVFRALAFAGLAVVWASVALLWGLGVMTAPVLAQGEADSLGTRPDSTLGARPKEDLWEAHPDYTLKINKRKDVTNWESRIGLNKALSDKISLNLSGSVTTRENSTLNRSDSNNGTNAALRYKLNNNISFSMNYNSSLSAYRYDLSRGASADRRRNDDVTISSELTRKLFQSVDLNLKAVAGSTSNSFAGVSNTGRRQDLSASVSYAPTSTLKMSAAYGGNRLFLNSRVDSGGSSVFNTQDRTFSEDLSASLTYEMLPGIKLGADVSEGRDQRQHPDPVEKKQETELRDSKSASVTSSFNILTRLTWDLSVRFNSTDNKYVIRNTSNHKTNMAELDGSAKIKAWRGADINLGGTREVERDEYELTAETGDNIRKSLSLRLAQDLGPRADLGFTALSDFTSTLYDDKKKNPKDRDRLNNRLAVDLTLLPFANVTTRLGGEFSEEEQAYVKSEASANNRTSRRYRVSGSYDVKTAYAIGINQSYDIGAVYSLYQYDEANNSLVRNSSILTRFTVPVTPDFGLNLNHDYRYQDQGSYQEVGGSGQYGRSAGNASNTFAVGVSYSLWKLRFNVRQAYLLQTNWKFQGGKKLLDYQTASTEISGRAGFKYSFKDRTHVSLSLEHNRKEGSRVSEAFRRYWNIELEASHVF
ncbi:MAG: hypothetical protein V1694_07815 [Candidatus Eisenbacteria bacterium]